MGPFHYQDFLYFHRSFCPTHQNKKDCEHISPLRPVLYPEKQAQIKGERGEGVWQERGGGGEENGFSFGLFDPLKNRQENQREELPLWATWQPRYSEEPSHYKRSRLSDCLFHASMGLKEGSQIKETLELNLGQETPVRKSKSGVVSENVPVSELLKAGGQEGNLGLLARQQRCAPGYYPGRIQKCPTSGHTNVTRMPTD